MTNISSQLFYKTTLMWRDFWNTTPNIGVIFGIDYKFFLLHKKNSSKFAEVSFHHLRTQDGREIDLLVETQDGYYAFEIKMAYKISLLMHDI